MKRITPCLQVEDVNQSIKFYEEVLGFKTTMTHPREGQYEWVALQDGDAIFMLHAKSSKINEIPEIKKQAPGGALTFYLETDDAEATLNKIKGKATILREVYETFYGTKEFVLQDPNGFVWVFCQNVGCECPGSAAKEATCAG
jgi:uncharacterized glyoxalase superfamily protein PhnB